MFAQVSAGGFRGRRAGILAQGTAGGRGSGAGSSEGGAGGEQIPHRPPAGKRPPRGGGNLAVRSLALVGMLACALIGLRGRTTAVTPLQCFCLQ